MLPDVPTTRGAGLPATMLWLVGILTAGPHTAPIINRLTRKFEAMLASDEVKGLFLKNGQEVGYLNPTEFRRFMRERSANG